MRGMVGKVGRVRQPHIFTSLNLTSLIDLFTILVLFLLFNMASEGEVIPDCNILVEGDVVLGGHAFFLR